MYFLYRRMIYRSSSFHTRETKTANGNEVLSAKRSWKSYEFESARLLENYLIKYFLYKHNDWPIKISLRWKKNFCIKSNINFPTFPRYIYIYNQFFQRASVKCLAVQQLFYNGIFVLGRLLILKNAFYFSRLFNISKKKGRK